ncbi:MAG TPA: hypothetical protein VLK57_11205, partial [Pseudonocardia sp.]|nr:hypothetical protein [Pseudonocardia sp.]
MDLVAHPAQQGVDDPRDELLHRDQRLGRTADDEIPHGVRGGVHDRVGDDPCRVGGWRRDRLDPHLGAGVVEQRSVDRAGHDLGDAHRDTVALQFHAQGLEEAVDAVLGRAVGGLQGDAALRAHRRHRDERAAVTSQVRQRGLGAVHLPEQVDVQHPRELLGGGVVESGDQQHAGHVHPGVEAPVRVDGSVGDGLHLRGIGDVGDDGGRRAARRLDLGDERCESGLAAGGDDDLRALLGEAQGGGPADAAGGAHHDDDLVCDGFELHGKSFVRRRDGRRRGR